MLIVEYKEVELNKRVQDLKLNQSYYQFHNVSNGHVIYHLI
jgi:hypothetical protein